MDLLDNVMNGDVLVDGTGEMLWVMDQCHIGTGTDIWIKFCVIPLIGNSSCRWSSKHETFRLSGAFADHRKSPQDILYIKKMHEIKDFWRKVDVESLREYYLFNPHKFRWDLTGVDRPVYAPWYFATIKLMNTHAPEADKIPETLYSKYEEMAQTPNSFQGSVAKSIVEDANRGTFKRTVLLHWSNSRSVRDETAVLVALDCEAFSRRAHGETFLTDMLKKLQRGY
jgi:hypothetical protein